VLGLKVDNEEMGFTFGWSFIKAYYTVFDREKQRLGIFLVLKLGFKCYFRLRKIKTESIKLTFLKKNQ
jgi:hypothetical protein